MTRRRNLLLLPAALLLARCGGPAPKPPAVLTLTMAGGSDQNPDPSGNPAPLKVMVYQLGATGKFESSDWTALTEQEVPTLGQDETAAAQPFVIGPGETQTKTFEMKSGTQAIGIVALYRDIDHATWRADAPVADSGPTKLTLTISKLAVKLAPTPPPK
jgi:type VI secretion system protein VasD